MNAASILSFINLPAISPAQSMGAALYPSPSKERRTDSPLLKDISLSEEKPPISTPILFFLSALFPFFLNPFPSSPKLFRPPQKLPVLADHLYLRLKHYALFAVDAVPYNGHERQHIPGPFIASFHYIVCVDIGHLRIPDDFPFKPGLFYEFSRKEARRVFKDGTGASVFHRAFRVSSLP